MARQGRSPAPAGLIALDGQALAALGATGVQDSTTTAGLHADEEAVGTGALDFGRLVSAFHGATADFEETLDYCKKTGKGQIIHQQALLVSLSMVEIQHVDNSGLPTTMQRCRAGAVHTRPFFSRPHSPS
jgi:hypothetical protein